VSDAIAAEHLVKRFGDVVAVGGVDLRVDEGDVRGLLGPNGAGKTTLLRMLFGLVRPDGGAARLFGRSWDEAGPRMLDGVAGFVEEPRFYPYLSARRNLELLAALDGGAARREVDDALERVALARSAGQKVGGFSSGMRQRLGLAAALLRKPRLLLLDEPTSGLDPGGAREARELIRALGADGVTILMSSHDMVEVETVCDSVTVMRRGAVVWDGTLERLREMAPSGAHRLRTSDDARAVEIARAQPGVQVSAAAAGGVDVAAETGALDAYVLALGREQIAVRSLELVTGPLEAMFFTLTGEESGA
jgi:ABC-2 type transport system ATP-binding protein